MQIKLTGVSKIYNREDALHEVSTVVGTGETLLLAGPNGAGKSTLLRLLAGVDMPSRGTIQADTCSVGSTVYQDRIGYLPQHPRFYDHLTPWEWLHYLARLKMLPGKMVAARVNYLATEMGWSEALSTPLGQLSPGVQQRVAIASAYLNDPEMVLLDEPLTNLDPDARLSLLHWISTQSPGRITIMATHTLAGLEYLTDRVWLLVKGRLVTDMGMQEVLQVVVGRIWQLTRCQAMGPPECDHLLGQRNVDGNVEWRILSSKQPAGAIPVEPTLEDAYIALTTSR